MEAAANAFANHGYDGASMGAIAQDAGLSKASVLYHFESKQALWEATVDDVFGRAIDSLMAKVTRSSAPGGTPPLAALIDAFVAVCQENRPYVLIPIVEGIKDSPRTDYIARKHLVGHSAAFRRFLEQSLGQPVSAEMALHLQNVVAGGAQLYIGLAPLWTSALERDTTEAKSLDEFRAFITQTFSTRFPGLEALLTS